MQMRQEMDLRRSSVHNKWLLQKMLHRERLLWLLCSMMLSEPYLRPWRCSAIQFLL
jgi:hypothetical protein